MRTGVLIWASRRQKILGKSRRKRKHCNRNHLKIKLKNGLRKVDRYVRLSRDVIMMTGRIKV